MLLAEATADPVFLHLFFLFCSFLCFTSIVYCLISIVFFKLSIVNCLISIVNCLISIVNCLISIVNCLISIVNCLISIVNCFAGHGPIGEKCHRLLQMVSTHLPFRSKILGSIVFVIFMLEPVKFLYKIYTVCIFCGKV